MQIMRLLHFDINSNLTSPRYCGKYGGKYYMSFVENLILFSVVKEFKN